VIGKVQEWRCQNNPVNPADRRPGRETPDRRYILSFPQAGCQGPTLINW
jgi:hypothetical protein